MSNLDETDSGYINDNVIKDYTTTNDGFDGWSDDRTYLDGFTYGTTIPNSLDMFVTVATFLRAMADTGKKVADLQTDNLSDPSKLAAMQQLLGLHAVLTTACTHSIKGITDTNRQVARNFA